MGLILVTGTIIKSCTISISICLALMFLIFSSVTGYALITTQSISVLDLYIANVSEEGMFIRISTDIWYVVAITVAVLMLFIYVVHLDRKRKLH